MDTFNVFMRHYIRLASSMLRFIYMAASADFIGDCFDSSIFRILRSADSLWNWLK